MYVRAPNVYIHVRANSQNDLKYKHSGRATHTYTLATALTPLPQRQGLPRESPPQCLRACRLGYEPDWYYGTMVRTRVRCTMVRYLKNDLKRPYHYILFFFFFLVWYTCTNITLSQKQLEIQALRCNVLEYHGTRVPWYHWYHICYHGTL